MLEHRISHLMASYLGNDRYISRWQGWWGDRSLLLWGQSPMAHPAGRTKRSLELRLLSGLLVSWCTDSLTAWTFEVKINK